MLCVSPSVYLSRTQLLLVRLCECVAFFAYCCHPSRPSPSLQELAELISHAAEVDGMSSLFIKTLNWTAVSVNATATFQVRALLALWCCCCNRIADTAVCCYGATVAGHVIAVSE